MSDSLTTMLKTATAEAHRTAESNALQRRLIQGSIDADELVAFLGQMFHVHRFLEDAMASLPDIAARIGWTAGCHHSERLAGDLAAFGAAVPPVEPATQVFLAAVDAALAKDPIAVVGMFYVLEGSMNGNRYIVRALAHGPLGATGSFTYFDPYGESQPAIWAEFKTRLDELTLTEPGRAAVLAAAHHTFDGITSISTAVAPAAL